MRKIVFILFLGILLSACAPASTPLPTEVLPSATPTPSHTPTPTIIWFPATETPTATPEIIQSPTPDLRESFGALILDENFDQPDDWHFYPVGNGNISIANNHLTMVLNQADQYAYANHKNLILRNFYGEIIATPNLCGDKDEYGIIFRTMDLQDFYRLEISCDGFARVNRMMDGFLYSVVVGEVIEFQQTGPPVSVKISVWVSGFDVNVYINDQFQFSFTDYLLTIGSFGTYVRTVGESNISVNFSELVIWELD